MPEHTLTIISKKTILCALTGQFAHQICLSYFWTEDPTHDNDIKNPPAFDAALREISRLMPLHHITRIIRYASPNSPLTVDTLVT